MPSLTLDALRARLPGSQLDPLYLVLGDDERGKDEAVAAFVGDRPRGRARLRARTGVGPGVRGIGDRRVGADAAVSRRPPRDHRHPGREVARRPPSQDRGRRRRGEEAGRRRPRGRSRRTSSPRRRSHARRRGRGRQPDAQGGQALLKQATTVECWGLKDEREARGPSIAEALERGGRLASAQLRKAGLAVDRRTLQPLLAHAGTDIGTLRGALDRLVLYCHGRSEVTLEDVRTIVGGAALVDDWAMVNAIERGDAREALRQVRLLIDEGDGPYRTLGQLAWFVRSRLAPSLPLDRARQVVNAVFETDLAMKSSGGEPKVLLERLVMELCGVRGPGFAPGRGAYDARRQGSGR